MKANFVLLLWYMCVMLRKTSENDQVTAAAMLLVGLEIRTIIDTPCVWYAESACIIDEPEPSTINRETVEGAMTVDTTSQTNNDVIPIAFFSFLQAAMEPPLARSPMLPNAPLGEVWPSDTQARACRTCACDSQRPIVAKTPSLRRLVISNHGIVDASRLYDEGG